MTTNDYPDDMSNHVRDPKIFKKNDKYYMVLGARDKEGIGMILLYESADLKNWTYKNRITTPQKFGYMWECPDLFEIDGQLYIICCPQGVETQGIDYENVHQVTAMKLNYDFETDEYEITDIKLFDRGFDFYAPQVMECGDRKILFAWFAIPDSPGIEMEDGWRHLLTIPRELKVASDNSLLMTPIEELKKLRTKVLEKTVPGSSWNCNIENQPLELLLTGRYEELCFEIADKNEPLLEFTLKKDNIVLKQKREDGWQIRTCSYYDDIMRKMQIYMDYSTIEVFINDGRYVFSSRIYPVGSLDFRINAAADNEDGSLEIYSLSL